MGQFDSETTLPALKRLAPAEGTHLCRLTTDDLSLIILTTIDNKPTHTNTTSQSRIGNNIIYKQQRGYYSLDVSVRKTFATLRLLKMFILLFLSFLLARGLLRSDEDKACALECAARPEYGSVFVQHLRKAGGTMLRHFFSAYRCGGRESVPVVVEESRVLSGMLAPMTLYVTCIRDPVERIISSYHFEGRWPQKERRKREENAISLEDWFDEVFMASYRRDLYHRKSIWTEVRNYYVQIFSGSVTRIVGEEHYEAARETLSSFDVVLVLERLQSEEGRIKATKRLRAALNIDEEAKYACLPYLAQANSAKRSVVVNQSQRMWIESYNTWDRKLYDEALQMQYSTLEKCTKTPTHVSCSQSRNMTIDRGEHITCENFVPCSD